MLDGSLFSLLTFSLSPAYVALWKLSQVLLLLLVMALCSGSTFAQLAKQAGRLTLLVVEATYDSPLEGVRLQHAEQEEWTIAKSMDACLGCEHAGDLDSCINATCSAAYVLKLF